MAEAGGSSCTIRSQYYYSVIIYHPSVIGDPVMAAGSWRVTIHNSGSAYISQPQRVHWAQFISQVLFHNNRCVQSCPIKNHLCFTIQHSPLGTIQVPDSNHHLSFVCCIVGDPVMVTVFYLAGGSSVIHHTSRQATSYREQLSLM